jgi:hypothetical protein
VAKYKLNVKFTDVDSLTGVTANVNYRLKYGNTVENNIYGLPISGNTATKTLTTKADKITGKVYFLNTGNGSFTSNGETYEFVNPGAQPFKIKSKGGGTATKTIQINLEKAPLTAPTTNTFLEPSDDFLSFAAISDTLA